MTILSEELNALIDLRVPKPIIPLVKDCFKTISLFQIQHMEDKYIAISHNEAIDGLFYWDNFNIFLRADLTNILNLHQITLVDDSEMRLEHLNDIVRTLHQIQHLEDYEQLARYVTNVDDPKLSFIKTLSYYSKVEFIILMENIMSVGEEFLENLTKFIEAKLFNEEIEQLSGDYTLFFFHYIGDQECLGKTLYDRGYDGIMTLEETTQHIDVDCSTYFENRAKSGQPSFAALDLLSLYMITSDGREKPVELMKEHLETYFEDPIIQQTVYSIFLSLFSDFKSHHDLVVSQNGGYNNANA